MYVPPPPARRGWGPKILVGAVSFLVLSVASSAAAIAAYRIGERRVVFIQPSSSTVVGASGDDETRKRAEVEESDPSPSTPTASLAARPTWSTEGWAPQVSQPVELFAEASPIASDLDGAFLLCRFTSFGQADTFAGDDLKVNAIFGKAPEISVNGPEDANFAFVSAPVITLHKGDGLRFEVYDRDVFGDTLLTRSHPAFGGKLADTDRGASYECRTLSAKDHARIVKTHDAAADGRLAELAHKHLAPTDATWAFPGGDLAHAKAATADIAALTGWADPRAVRRVHRIESELERLEAEKPAVFAGLHAKASTHAKLGGLDVRLGAVDCAGTSCTSHLAITNTGSSDVDLESVFAPDVYVASAESGPVREHWQSVTIASKTSADVTVESTSVPLSNAPSILGICDRRACAVLATR